MLPLWIIVRRRAVIFRNGVLGLGKLMNAGRRISSISRTIHQGQT